MDKQIVNHWGKWVDSTVPVTGVISNNTPDFLVGESDDGIDLDYLQHTMKCELCQAGEDCPESEMWETSDDTILIGSWKMDADGQCKPDESGEYAAIMRESVTQVIWSRTTRTGALCSPCYPGQVDLDTPGQFLAFDLPRDMYGDSFPANTGKDN